MKVYIDKLKLYEVIHDNPASEPSKRCAQLLEAILKAPEEDVVEVKHGEWIFGTANHREYMKCSECLHAQTPTGVFVYCPICGAKMDGERSGNGKKID